MSGKTEICGKGQCQAVLPAQSPSAGAHEQQIAPPWPSVHPAVASCSVCVSDLILAKDSSNLDLAFLHNQAVESL